MSSGLAESSNLQRVEKIDSKFKQLTKNTNCPIILATDLIKLIKAKKVTLIDVRTEAEQKISMLPGAITQKEFEKSPESFRSNQLIAYCTIGYRSGKFAEKFQKYKIKNLKGGVLAWSHAKGNFIQNGKITKKVHTYSKDWNFLNSNYQAVIK